jgi:hypothetical protein
MHRTPGRLIARLACVSALVALALPSACSPADPGSGHVVPSRQNKPERVVATILLRQDKLTLVGLRAKTDSELPPAHAAKAELEWRFESDSGELLANGSMPHPLRTKSEFSGGVAKPAQHIVGANVFEVELPNRTGVFRLFPPGSNGGSGGMTELQGWSDIWEPLEVLIEEIADDVWQFLDEDDDVLSVGPTERIVKPTSKCTAFSFLIAAEGYTEDQQDEFQEDVDDVVYDLAYNLGAANWSKVAVWRTFFESRESGMSVADKGIDRDTAFRVVQEDSTSTGIWMGDDVPAETLAALAAAKKTASADLVLVVVNSTVDAGSASSDERIGFFTSDGEDPVGDVASHELGHILGLADEYDYGDCDLSTADDWPNVATGEPYPWDALLTAGVPIPTTEADSKIVGAYEGAYECGSGVYRPQHTCMMQTTDSAFCQVCKAHIADVFNKRAPACAPPKPDCAHSECEEGAALTKTCTPCAAAVCSYLPECCEEDGFWDAHCVEKAQDIPGACRGVCAVEDSTCEHSECEEGVALHAYCSSCSESVCEKDSFCCEEEWDHICVSEAEKDPFCACGG